MLGLFLVCKRQFIQENLHGHWILLQIVEEVGNFVRRFILHLAHGLWVLQSLQFGCNLGKVRYSLEVSHSGTHHLGEVSPGKGLVHKLLSVATLIHNT